ncbi:hypothetical protein EE612_030157 [Oryza sativa]|nr:hypothetical protein EE612_030157 [Oryza sativa]
MQTLNCDIFYCGEVDVEKGVQNKGQRFYSCKNLKKHTPCLLIVLKKIGRRYREVLENQK